MMSFGGSNDRVESKISTSTTQWLQPSRKFELQEILIATENFNDSFVIGSGGFGKVYRGEVIVGTGRVVAALKRLDPMSNQGAAEFWAEVEMLSNLRHSHIVSLIGYCNYEREMILVYEYIPNGTLEDHLHKLRTRLSWVDRLKICIGAARGLDYLHTGTGIEFGVIHRDVKSSNILLLQSWEAKISDFGLSRKGPTNQPHTYVETLVKGTFGYLDPSYFATGKLTRKSDVYAFGVVLFEVLCRKRPVDNSFEYGLATWAKESIKEGKLKDIVDSDIRDEISPKCLKEFARIAERCLDDYHPKDRPTMTEVIFGLESVLNLQLQTPGKSIFTRMVDVFPSFNTTGENSATGFGFLTTKNQKQLMLRKKLFERHGILHKEAEATMTIFTFKMLEVATRNFANDMIIGRGASGFVRKGILPDNRVVAIKRTRIFDSDGLEKLLHFSKINHPNVVQILGCCLETEVPLLVYEYVSNGNLYDHIHNIGSGTTTRLSWDRRLCIAYDTASALAFLHTYSTIPIIHGYMMSTEILLDENSTAKIAVSDDSCLLHEDSDERITLYETLCYLDPEYILRGHLTDKSDVYSFGVVLAELLTGLKPFSKRRGILARYFKRVVSGNRMLEIVDHQVLKEATGEQLKAACELACRCVEEAGVNRPSMKEVAMELETIRKLGKHHPSNQQNYKEPRSTLVAESEQAVNLRSDIDSLEYENNESELLDLFRFKVQALPR